MGSTISNNILSYYDNENKTLVDSLVFSLAIVLKGLKLTDKQAH